MAHADPASVPILQRFFKTGPGEYGERDVFVGVRVPAMRSVCRECRGAPLDTIRTLLRSRVHEERSLALMLLVDAFKAADEAGRQAIYDLYLSHTVSINNWDLVDASAAQILGGWLHPRDRAPLRTLAASVSLWERRMAIIATANFIKRGEFDDTFAIADMLLHDEHDLIHKAVGWMLREVGKRDEDVLRRFLDEHAPRMPRTALRYALERMSEAQRRRYMSIPRVSR